MTVTTAREMDQRAGLDNLDQAPAILAAVGRESS
jgi:hypothetical protein